MTIEQLFTGFDHSKHEAEVRDRWGDRAWENSLKKRANTTEEQLKKETQRSIDINQALRDAADANEKPESPHFQALVADHYLWVTENWGGRKPTKAAYAGLSEMYVADARFAVVYGGEDNAKIIREAIGVWIEANL